MHDGGGGGLPDGVRHGVGEEVRDGQRDGAADGVRGGHRRRHGDQVSRRERETANPLQIFIAGTPTVLWDSRNFLTENYANELCNHFRVK